MEQPIFWCCRSDNRFETGVYGPANRPDLTQTCLICYPACIKYIQTRVCVLTEQFETNPDDGSAYNSGGMIVLVRRPKVPLGYFALSFFFKCVCHQYHFGYLYSDKN